MAVLPRWKAEKIYVRLATEEVLSVLPENPRLALRALTAAHRRRLPLLPTFRDGLVGAVAVLLAGIVIKVTAFPGPAEAHIASWIHWRFREIVPIAVRDESMERVAVLPNGEAYAVTVTRRAGEPYAVFHVTKERKLNGTVEFESAVRAASEPQAFNPFR